ncbi:MAG: hypothetical protein FJ030_18145 [Chloroflexi bacterium]|nr:hypothetical protein [Chloroflexota bacterium]
MSASPGNIVARVHVYLVDQTFYVAPCSFSIGPGWGTPNTDFKWVDNEPFLVVRAKNVGALASAITHAADLSEGDITDSADFDNIVKSARAFWWLEEDEAQMVTLGGASSGCFYGAGNNLRLDHGKSVAKVIHESVHNLL